MPWDPIDGDTEIVAIHAALLPTSEGGDILLFGDWANLSSQAQSAFTDWRIFRVGTSEILKLPIDDFADQNAEKILRTPDRDLFCSGHAFLADGRLIVGGGNLMSNEVPAGNRFHQEHNMFGGGERACWIYHPRKMSWVEAGELGLAPNGSQNSGGRWYPVLVTLANGKVFATGGHPDLRENFLYQAQDEDALPLGEGTSHSHPAAPADPVSHLHHPFATRRNNNTPEIFSPATGQWRYFPTHDNPSAEKTAPNNLQTDSYPRFRVMPSGRLFCDTAGRSPHNNVTDGQRFYDPNTGAWVGPEVNSTILPFNRGSATTSVLMPLLPPVYQARVLACNASRETAFYLDADERSDETLIWQMTASRDGTTIERADGCAVLLPTGQVFLSGGSEKVPEESEHENSHRRAVEEPELYTPAINWQTGAYTNYNEANDINQPQDGSWETLTGAGDRQSIGRGYHSVALLLPDGRVWTAGTTESAKDVNLAQSELTMQAYRPWYMSGSRPGIKRVQPAVGYGDRFRVDMETDQTIVRVAFTRCGSVTHAFDFDQRYVGASFQQSGNRLMVTAPPNSSIAPSGYYLLWAINEAGRPCTQAKFIRVTHLDVYYSLQLSTYSRNAVRALKRPYTNADEAIFSGAIHLYYQGFLPHEVGVPGTVPTISWRFLDGGGAVPGMRLVPRSGNPGWQVDPVVFPDVGQKFSYVYDVVFDNEEAFDTFPDDGTRKVIVTATLGSLVVEVDLTLMKKANPYMKDGDTPWLSTDLRVFTEPVSVVNGVGSPELYLQSVLDSFNATPEGSNSHPFQFISTSQIDNPVSLDVPKSGNGVYNFAIARVSFLSIPDDNAQNVKVFFRLFNTVGTALEYSNQGTYKVLGSGTSAIPGLGKENFFITSIPFFGEPRVTPDQSMDKQTDNALNRQTLIGKGPDIDVAYFGCWLDINVTDKHFPLLPLNDGPFTTGFPQFLLSTVPMIQHIRGYHQCLVAEIFYGDDPTESGDTPFTSDNLAQRNLATVPAANPGLAITRTVQTTFEVEPSKAPTAILTASPSGGNVYSSTGARRRIRPDELVFTRNDLPPGVFVTLYMPDVSIDEVLAIAEARLAPPVFERIDKHTLRFELGTSVFVPVPGDRKTTIPGLMSVTLPLGIKAGETYTLHVQQYSGLTLRFLGAFQLAIPVDKKENLLSGETRKLSLLRYVAEAIPEQDRWYSIFKRYLGEIEGRVRGFGGNPDNVVPTPYGPDDGTSKDRDKDDVDTVRYDGKVASLLYDCYGDFEGFVLDQCPGEKRFQSREYAIETVVAHACSERQRITVFALASDTARAYRIQIYC